MDSHTQMKGNHHQMHYEKSPQDEQLIIQLTKTATYHQERMALASPDAISSPDEIEPSLYFITTKFADLPGSNYIPSRPNGTPADVSRKAFYEPADQIALTYNRQTDFYKHIVNQIVPNNHYPSKRKYYPVALSFIDVSGARFNRTSFTKIPHAHAVFIIHPKTKDRFDRLLERNFGLDEHMPKTRPILSIDSKEVWNLKEVLDYSSKFYRSNCAKSLDDDVFAKVFSIYGGLPTNKSIYDRYRQTNPIINTYVTPT